ncbi:isoleucine--tRNA ligase [Gammaproteobacteria bacterium]|nr:isoleucine--tRNA ligase [Gammaproteobacteria bacterium]
MSSTPTNEQKIQKFWQEQDIFKKTITQNQDKEPFMLYDGPPFATGLPHHGHLLTLTIKDTVQRYYAQNGYHVERRGGWDCHGLPIEHEINKQLNMSADKAVESLGVAGYNQQCRDIVMRYRKEWQTTIADLGRWIDFNQDYKTMDKDYMESVWWVFSEIWKKDLIYQGNKVMPYSTALGTPLSNFEAGSNYQSVQDPAVTVLIKLKDQERCIAIWTTTPWTLPANQAVAVHPDMEYVCVVHSDFDMPFWVAKQYASTQLDAPKTIDECTGKDFIGLDYEPLFDVENIESSWYKILPADFIDTETGTGMVHMAPAFGEDDNQTCLAHHISTFISPLNGQGIYTNAFPAFEGLSFKEADKAIIKDLKSRSCILKHETITHNYPFCPRSDTPLIYMAVPSWFLSVSQIQDQIIANNEKVNWVPSHIKHGRFGKWLSGAKDWALSRNRVWGTPIPIWINDTTQNMKCIGSVSELEQLTKQNISDLHREHIDHLTFNIDNEPGVYRRVDEVLDCWFESGAMPYAKVHYPFENKLEFEKSFPAQCIAEGLDQTRGWFYTLMVLSTALFNKPAFENVIVSGIVMAEDGKKMSKRLKNYTAPDALMSSYGADALRLYLISSNLVKGEEMKFSDEGVKQMNRSSMIPLLNALKFFQTYADLDSYQHLAAAEISTVPLDTWLLSRLQSLKQLIAKSMQEYKLYQITPQIIQFVDELTNTYIRMNRARFWGENNDRDKQYAYATLYTALFEVAHILAPFTPYISENLYLALKSYHPSKLPESVHLTTYPNADSALINQDLEAAVKMMHDIINMGRAKRVEKSIRIKTPLQSIKIIHPDENIRTSLARFSDKIKSELNVKTVSFSDDESEFVSLSALPNLPLVGKRLGKKLPAIRQAIAKLSSEEIALYENSGSIEIEGETFQSSELIVRRESKSGLDAISNEHITIVLNTKLSKELINEGIAREMISKIQKTRKELDLNVAHRITLTIQGDENFLQVFDTFNAYITQEVLATELVITHAPQVFRFDGEQATFSISTSDKQ